MIESEKNMIRVMAEQGLNDCQIAEIMHYSRAHISETRRNMGIHRKRGKSCTLSRETIARMCELRRCGLSYLQIGRQLKMSRYTVYSCIKREERKRNPNVTVKH